MADPRLALVERLYECFNQRDEACLAKICAERMEFFPTVTARAIGREAPYRGPTGLHEYLADVAKVWEDLRVTASEVELRGDALLVRGRVYARSRELGIRDVPVAWIWEVRDERVVRGEVFADPERAALSFAARDG